MLKKLTAAGIVAAAASGALLLAAPANAGTSGGNGGVLAGNQIIVPVSIPVNICGNSVAVLGISRAGCRGGASSGLYHHRYHPHWVS